MNRGAVCACTWDVRVGRLPRRDGGLAVLFTGLGGAFFKGGAFVRFVGGRLTAGFGAIHGLSTLTQCPRICASRFCSCVRSGPLLLKPMVSERAPPTHPASLLPVRSAHEPPIQQRAVPTWRASQCSGAAHHCHASHPPVTFRAGRWSNGGLAQQAAWHAAALVISGCGFRSAAGSHLTPSSRRGKVSAHCQRARHAPTPTLASLLPALARRRRSAALCSVPLARKAQSCERALLIGPQKPRANRPSSALSKAASAAASSSAGSNSMLPLAVALPRAHCCTTRRSEVSAPVG